MSSAADEETPEPSGLKSPTSTSPPDSASSTPAQNPISPPSEPAALKPPVVPPARKISGALLKASLASLSLDDAGSSVSFAPLSHSLPQVLAQSANGVQTVRKVSDFIDRIVRAKQAYAAACLAAVAEAARQQPAASPAPTGKTLNPSPSRPRAGSVGGGSSAATAPPAPKPRSSSSAGLSSDEEIGTRFLHAWHTLRDVVQAEAISDAAAAKAYHETVAAPLSAYHSELKQKHAVLKEHAEQMQQQVRHSQERLLDSKIAALRLVEAQRLAEEREQAESEEKQRAEAAGRSSAVEIAKAGKSLKSGLAFLFKSKDKQLTEALQSLSSGELRQQAYEATLLYAQAVDVANARAATYYDHDLSTVLRQLQMMEATRLETLRLHLHSLTQHLQGVMEPADRRVASFTAAVQAMETRADLEDFVTALSSSVGLALSSRPNPFVYELHFTADDVKAGRARLQPPPQEPRAPDLFGSSLEQVMERQKGGPHAGLDVPWLLPLLCDTIRSGGKPVYAETVDSDEVMRARRRLEDGEQAVDGAEVAAAVLKLWLRCLEPRLISREAYTAAVDAARETERREEKVLEVFASLPPLQQRVLLQVCRVMLEVSAASPAALDQTAMVLAPNLLQNPQQDDAATVLSHINHEVAFVRQLLLSANRLQPAHAPHPPADAPPAAETAAEPAAHTEQDGHVFAEEETTTAT